MKNPRTASNAPVYGLNQPTAAKLGATIDKVYGKANRGRWTRLVAHERLASVRNIIAAVR